MARSPAQNWSFLAEPEHTLTLPEATLLREANWWDESLPASFSVRWDSGSIPINAEMSEVKYKAQNAGWYVSPGGIKMPITEWQFTSPERMTP